MMPDREKIESLKQCLSASCRGFRICPYSDTEWDAIETALELLKEHEAVKPKKGVWLHPISLDCCCSACGRQPEHEPGKSVPLYLYCPYCGAKMEVKWDAD